MRRRLALVMAAVAASCGSGAHQDGDAGVGGVPVVPDGVEPIESFEADRITAACEARARCHQVATVDGCVKGTVGLISPLIVADVQAGVTRYDPHLGYHCVALTRATACLGAPDFESCQNAFTGTLPAGAACTLATECASGSCATTNCGADCCPGTCADGVMVRGIPRGGACGAGLCDEGLYCSNMGVCAPRVDVGGACGGGPICQQGLTCDSSLGPACARLSVAGEPCATTFCEVSQAFCDAATRICRSPPAVGDPCTGVTECGLALNCVNGVCTVPGVVGEPCVGPSGSVQCQHGYSAYGAVECTNGMCAQVDRAPAGLACATP